MSYKELEKKLDRVIRTFTKGTNHNCLVIIDKGFDSLMCGLMPGLEGGSQLEGAGYCPEYLESLDHKDLTRDYKAELKVRTFPIGLN